MKTVIVTTLLLLAAGCAGMDVGVQQQGTLPRGFSQPGSPFPYNGTGW